MNVEKNHIGNGFEKIIILKLNSNLAVCPIEVMVRVVMLNTTFNNISAIS